MTVVEDKRQRIAPEEHLQLKAGKLVEGRYPSLIVAAEVAAATGEKARHIRDSGLDSQYYRDLIVTLVRRHQPVSRQDIDGMLLGKLPEVLNEQQKKNKVRNLIQQLAREGGIRNVGSRGKPQWVVGEN